MSSFQIPVLGLLSVSFRSSLIRSHSCSSGAYLLLSLSVFPLLFRFLSSASFPVLTTQSLFLLFLLFPLPPHSGFHAASVSAFASPVFPVLSRLVSRAFLPGSKYSAFCLFPFILFPSFASHSCSTGASLLLSLPGHPLLSAFFRPLLSGSDYSAFCAFFSLLPVFPSQWFFRC